MRDQQSEFAIAQHRDLLARRDRDLIQDLARGGQRFQENSALGGEAVGQDVQVALG